VAKFGGDFGWTYDQGTADYAVKTIKTDGLVANGADGTFIRRDSLDTGVKVPMWLLFSF